MMNQLNKVRAFAPATSANVAVGFDILGFAIKDLGDEVTLTKSVDDYLSITNILGKDKLPLDVHKNTATVALQAMLDDLNIKQGFEVHIKKNIPLGSGLGGSAASSVAALVALNRFLTEPLSIEELVPYALCGEEIACGFKHGDNVIPCLFGGMTLIQSLSPLSVIELPVIPLYTVFMHPHLRLDTRDSRAALTKKVSLTHCIKQCANLASFISAIYERDYERLSRACKDELIEPMRAPLIPYFYEVKAAAFHAGALACSISGSGPTVFALAKTNKCALQIAEQMFIEFYKNAIECDSILTTVSSQGARVIHEE